MPIFWKIKASSTYPGTLLHAPLLKEGLDRGGALGRGKKGDWKGLGSFGVEV